MFSSTFPKIVHLLVLFGILPVVRTTAKPVDIFNNPGEGDILQLRNLKNNDTRAYNALYSLSSEKWNITDEDGNIVIPYAITGKFNLSEEATIANAMQRVMDNTCIRFIKHTDEQDYIDFVNKPGEGCYTSVGRQGGRTVVQLESNKVATCMKTNLVLHELLHVVGLWHEHQRHDRDSYGQILYENVFKDFHDQFIKITPNQATTYDVPYDYKSLMHYGKMPSQCPIKSAC
ncbi:hypothetical protein V3C99_005181 [Haemonchus contortus]|uniref:Metalloendopeptidase n=1 Tax=Haemonchus contortus TaxID=6289 RepID=A0A7I4XV84_HAECO